MNNLAYTSQDPAYIGEKVEEKVREEIESAAPIPYQVETGEAGTATVGSFLSDIGNALIGGKDETLFRLNFDLAQRRPANLQVSMNRQGVGAHAGLLMYSTRISKPVAAEVALEDPKFFGNSKFAGDAGAAARLNGNSDLIKRCNELARVESQSGGLTLKIKRCCKVIPHEGGSMLVVGTLPRPTKMGFSAALDAKDFFEIADMVEAAL
ncbi:MAG TPA: hypothetical protein VE961_15925 [Pyrinomonadaceae bacterium]|nr:hypothetical protein [Pyrinomonadaceae bacterium]